MKTFALISWVALATAGSAAAAEDEFADYIQVGDTPVVMQLNFKPKVDATYDTKNTGANFRFVPAKFPLEGSPEAGDRGTFNMNANASALTVDVRRPDDPGAFRLYYQNDFFGDDDKAMRYRLQHFYGQYQGFTAGFTTSLWENGDIWPATVDYEGPNAVIFARRAVLQYRFVLNSSLDLNVGIEDPDYFVDGGTVSSRLPDVPVNLRWTTEAGGRVQLSGILREIGARDEMGVEDEVFGWGVNLGANLPLFQADSLQLLGVVGEGVGGMGNDAGFVDSDAGYNANGELEALPYWSVMIGYTHQWNEAYRSTITYGYVDLESTEAMDPTFYANSTYSSANLVYQLGPLWNVGCEVLYGHKEARNGEESGDIYRFQIGMSYAIF